MSQELQERFGIPGVVAFDDGLGGQTRIRVTTPLAEAEVYLLGAHVTRFKPAGAEEVLWLSGESQFAIGQAIRGGVPVCHPWFAAYASDASAPLHGYVRIMPWDVEGVTLEEDGTVTLAFWIKFHQPQNPDWPGEFELRHRVRVGSALTMELETLNCGPGPLMLTEALHTYFAVSDIRNVTVTGLAGCEYFDKVAGDRKKQSDEPIAFAGETDRAYFDTTTTCVIDDPGLDRRIHVAKRGSRSTVVWNPWTAKAASMPDFGDDEWPGMLCVETANCLDDAMCLPPGGTHRMTARISLEPVPEEFAAAPPLEVEADLRPVAAGAPAAAPPVLAAPDAGEAAEALDPDAAAFTARVFIEAPPPAVFEAWATAEGLCEWLVESAMFTAPGERVPRADGAARTGDSYQWRWQASGYVMDGTVLAAEWPERFGFTFAEAGSCEVTFTRHGAGTLVALRQAGLPSPATHLECRTGWTFFLTNLKSLLEGGLDLRETDPLRKGVVNR